MNDKSVSIVIPICSPQKELVVIIDRLLKQNKKPDEIILINSKRCFDGSEIILEEIEEKFGADNNIIKTIYYFALNKITKLYLLAFLFLFIWIICNHIITYLLNNKSSSELLGILFL